MDALAHLHDLMGQLAMQALAVGSQLAFSVGMASPGRFVPLAFFPGQTPAFFDPTLLVVVFRIVGSALAIQLALQSSLCSRVGDDFLTERHEVGFALAWHDGQRLGANIEADDVVPLLLMFGPGERVPLSDQLDARSGCHRDQLLWLVETKLCAG